MRWENPLHRLLASVLLLALVSVMGSCGGGGGGGDALPSIAILNPTAADTYATTATGVRLGGSISGASFVHVLNTTTGIEVEGYVNYFDGQGSWFADVYGLVPGDNFIVVTADADGSGARTASDTLTVSRPLQPASLILNGDDASSAIAYWVDANSFSHQIALYADGSGRSTTGNVLTEPAGVAVNMTWSYDGAEAIVVNGCPDCSYQRIGRIQGSTAEGLFYGQIETVGGVGETALHVFQLSSGSF
ncbi:MAG: hypothetical protein MUF33_14905 [Candidatus Nanopelagicales bacterium]|jgi:hypothetical protein|nr:hypothetical protein [Candidatus Nanopelagicales bacterium]MCU0299786.1 hypothetical protein [Candidatus Nanopelagicales bacterium]